MKSMGCSQIRDAFRANTLPAGPEVSAHVSGCAPCAELFADGARLGRDLAREYADTPARAMDAGAWAALEERLHAETGLRAFLRSRPTGQRIGLAAAAAIPAIVIGSHALTGEVTGAADRQALAWLAVFAVGVLVCASALFAPLGRRQWSFAVRAGLGLFALALPALHALSAGSAGSAAGVPDSEFVHRAAGCFFYGLALSVPFAAIIVLMDRSERTSTATALVTGAAAGLVGNIALGLHCMADERAHLALGHAPLGAAITVLSALAGAALATVAARRRG